MQKGTPVRAISRINSKTALIKTPARHDSGRHALEGRKFVNITYTNPSTPVTAMPANAAEGVNG